MEICFEKLSSPATYIASSGMLSSFSTGRPTSLVVDFGAKSTRIIPVIDGYVLNRAVIETSRGGDWMDRHTERELQSSGIAVKPWFETDGKNYPTPDKSFRDMHVRDTVKDVKHWMNLVTEKRIDDSMREEHFKGLNILEYELPDGTIVRHSAALCSAAEPLFISSTAARKRPRPAPPAGIPTQLQPLDVDVDTESLQDLIHASVLRCDVDVRKDLLQNILLVGGGSLIDGIPARLTNELTEILPTNMKVRQQFCFYQCVFCLPCSTFLTISAD
jgi:actin-related protein